MSASTGVGRVGPDPSALYVHVPFCSRKCPYCAFACTDDYRDSDVPVYIDGVGRELALRGFDRSFAPRTLYLGGGTPSALGADGLRALFTTLDATIRLDEVVETTVEVNPSHVDAPMAQLISARTGARVSLGTQSFSPLQLKRLGRDHEAPDTARAVALLRRAGIENLTADLMYGLPLQSPSAFMADVASILELSIPHVSLYNLEFEPTTPFGKAKGRGQMHGADDGTAADMFHRAREILSANGLAWYEVSNFSLPGRESLHNRCYWANEPYVGVGPGAYGRIGNERYSNVEDVKSWIERLRAGVVPTHETDVLTEAIDRTESLVAGLRTRNGVRDSTIGEGESSQALAVVEAERDGYLLKADGRIRPTLRGLILLDVVLRRLVASGAPA